MEIYTLPFFRQTHFDRCFALQDNGVDTVFMRVVPKDGIKASGPKWYRKKSTRFFPDGDPIRKWVSSDLGEVLDSVSEELRLQMLFHLDIL